MNWLLKSNLLLSLLVSLETFHLDYSGGGSEDCAYFLNRVISRGGMGTYMLVGSAIKAPHHNPLFDIDEEDMLNGVIALGTIAAHYLK